MTTQEVYKFFSRYLWAVRLSNRAVDRYGLHHPWTLYRDAETERRRSEYKSAYARYLNIPA